jgi:hypothetical protein
VIKRILSLLIHPIYRDPDVVIGQRHDPYLRRWHIIPRNRWCNLYLHHFLRSDDDRALHDHPWASVSIILKTGYLEHLPNHVIKLRRAGSIIFRRAEQAHRVELLRAIEYPKNEHVTFYLTPRPAWTLFITGRRTRQWGFHCGSGWRHWRVFLGVLDGEARGDEQGRGCE